MSGMQANYDTNSYEFKEYILFNNCYNLKKYFKTNLLYFGTNSSRDKIFHARFS